MNKLIVEKIKAIPGFVLCFLVLIFSVISWGLPKRLDRKLWGYASSPTSFKYFMIGVGLMLFVVAVVWLNQNARGKLKAIPLGWAPLGLCAVSVVCFYFYPDRRSPGLQFIVNGAALVAVVGSVFWLYKVFSSNAFKEFFEEFVEYLKAFIIFVCVGSGVLVVLWFIGIASK